MATKSKFVVQTRDREGGWSTCVPTRKGFRHGTSYKTRYQYEGVQEADGFKRRVVDYCKQNGIGITAARIINEKSGTVHEQVEVEP